MFLPAPKNAFCSSVCDWLLVLWKSIQKQNRNVSKSYRLSSILLSTHLPLFPSNSHIRRSVLVRPPHVCPKPTQVQIKPSYSPSSMPSTNEIIHQLHTRSCQRSRFRAIWSSIHVYRSQCHRAQDLILFHAFEATWQLGSSFHEKTQTRQADTSSSASGCVHSTLDGSLVVT